MGEPYKAGQAALWLQRFGPNTQPEYLGCHAIEDLEESFGDVTPHYCPDEAQTGKFKVSGVIEEAGELPTTTIATDVAPVADLIEKVRCPATLFVHKQSCGRRDLFNNWDRSFVLDRFYRTGHSYSDLAAKDPGDNAVSGQSMPITAMELLKLLRVEAVRQSNTGGADLLAITSCNVETCADDCGPYSERGDYRVAVGKTVSGSAASTALILISHDAGATWTAAAADPFAAAEDISAVGCFAVDRNTTRIIVARGTTDAGNPAEIAYSDDDGATWTLVDVGAVNGQYVIEAEGLFALDQYHIWLATTDGYVYFSADGGLTWTAQEAGVETTEDLRGVAFDADGLVGYAVGDNNAILKTINNREWETVTGPAAQAAAEIIALAVKDKRHVWIGYNDGELWYTEDGGENWYQRAFPGSGVGAVNAIAFENNLVGWMLHDTAAPVGSVLRTIDGGYTWQVVTPAPDNDGLTSLVSLGVNKCAVVGLIETATPVILEVMEAA